MLLIGHAKSDSYLRARHFDDTGMVFRRCNIRVDKSPAYKIEAGQ
jgi:hypothetical protein